MWVYEDKFAISSAFKRYARKHHAETASCFVNLEKVMALLNSGNKIGSFNLSFFRHEKAGIFRIGQRGRKGLKETRLYVFPDEDAQTMVLLTIGDKDSQSRDIEQAGNIVQQYKENQGD